MREAQDEALHLMQRPSKTRGEEGSQEGTEGSEDEDDEGSVEDHSGDEKQDDMIFSSWQEAMPKGGVSLEQPSGLTKKPLMNKKILLRGDHGWFRGRIQNVKRSGLVIIRYQIDTDDGKQQPLDMYQSLTMKPYGAQNIAGA